MSGLLDSNIVNALLTISYGVSGGSLTLARPAAALHIRPVAGRVHGQLVAQRLAAMGIPSGAFIAPSPQRDGGFVAAPTTMSSHLCGIGCEVAQGSPTGFVALAVVAVAAAIAVQRWRSRRA